MITISTSNYLKTISPEHGRVFWRRSAPLHQYLYQPTTVLPIIYFSKCRQITQEREKKITELARTLNITKQEAELILYTPSVLAEESEKMKQLAAGSPLGINANESNHCYIVAPLQCLANITGSNYPYKMPLIAETIKSYCEKKKSRKQSQDAIINIDSDSIEKALNQAEHGPAFRLGEQGDALDALMHFLTDDSYAYIVRTAKSPPLANEPKLHTDILLVRTAEQKDLPLQFSHKNGTYSLKGVIVHTGKLNKNLGATSGHFVTYLHTDKGFFHCNGSIVQIVSEADFKQAATGTSILFYLKSAQTRQNPAS